VTILALIGAFALFSIVALGLLLGCIYLILWGLGWFNDH
jgi:hypothetical protein